MNYQQTLEYLYNRLPTFQKIGADAYKPGLERVLKLLNKLDNPHHKYKIIHVGGTNGKGSTSNMLASILQSAGYKVGLYTSPHLVDFGERIRVNGQMIKESYVVDFVQQNQSLIEEVDPSFFETTMSMAFRYFADCKVDVAVVEVGLGGRLDSTNVVSPELAIITNIGYDHTQFLGDTLSKIAKEKAGIIKENIPVVIGERNNETDSIFLTESQKRNASIIFAQDFDFNFKEENNLFSFSLNSTDIKPELQSDYQKRNIQTVLASVHLLKEKGFSISENSIKNGLENVTENTHFQGRWQVIQQNPKIIVDTAHNSLGMKLVQKEIEKEDFANLYIIIGMVDDKDVDKVLELVPKKAIYCFTTPNTKRAISANKLAEIAQKKDLIGKSYPKPKDALSFVFSKIKSDDLLLIIGSNYLVGEILPLLSKK